MLLHFETWYKNIDNIAIGISAESPNLIAPESTNEFIGTIEIQPYQVDGV